MVAHDSSLLQSPLSPDVLTGALPEGSPQRELLTALPVSWDETRVLKGAKIGDLAPFARRKGWDWFVAVLNGETSRNYDLPLSFLSCKSYTAVVLSDDPARNDSWLVDKRTVRPGDRIAASMRPCGGLVVWL